ncbi:MAG TPA: GNAT family N-acetyltransferase [Solirubrobacterales bacterium]|nr:GNAT family N-acetyltransferase [Solirubrobacterales bacterium]
MRPETARPEILLQTVERDDPEVMALYEPFILEADGPLAHEVDVGAEAAKGPPADLVPPAGAMLLARVDGEPAAIGGVRHLDTPVAEVKSMYVSPAHRGLGLGRRILEELHRVAAESGCRAVRLDTSDYLIAAIGLYRAAGYREVPDYNRNPKASLWFERPL